MLDANDIWLQLPPRVLLERYYNTNALANRRLSSCAQVTLQQTIIVSAQKGCVAPRNFVSDMHCEDVPQSTLPSNVYGLLTDYKIAKAPFERPRFLNSGSFIGPAGDMLRLFARVQQRMQEEIERDLPETAGDQGIFAEIFGEQEIWRRNVSAQMRTEDFSGQQAALAARDEFEYHVGLDYAQELFYPTCQAENDGFFVRVDDFDDLEKRSSRAGVQPPRIQSLPDEILALDNPLGKLGMPQPGWGDISLYADFWTTSIPVVIHHNAWRHGEKSRRVSWWNETWYFPYLRQLLELQVMSYALDPLIRLAAAGGDLEVWPYDVGGLMKAPLIFGRDERREVMGLRPTSWHSVCRSWNATSEAEMAWYDEVFRDGRGPFEV